MNKSELRIIYTKHKPHGIRDSNGFLLFFPNLYKYNGQEERYREEVEEQYKLADYLLSALKERESE